MKRKLIWIALLCIASFTVFGCNWFQGPAQKKPDSVPKPAPQGMGSEPNILVYMHETGEKKNMKMEEYIAGVVAGEMKSDWPVEALAAQAILARTFTIEAMQTKGGVAQRGTDASTDIKEFQAYNAKAINDNVRKAVQMTRGEVITYKGAPIKAWFHASAGGITATAKEGLNFREAEPPYIKSVQAPDDLAPDDVKNWMATFTKKEVMDTLKTMGKNVSDIKSVAIGQKGPSGRTTVLRINDVDVAGAEFRVGIGSTKLKSMLLDSAAIEGDTVVFKGKGYGHGVGMSQWGAHKMAKEGRKPQEIVSHYFAGTEIQKQYQ